MGEVKIIKNEYYEDVVPKKLGVFLFRKSITIILTLKKFFILLTIKLGCLVNS